jgi:hypothetical protein
VKTSALLSQAAERLETLLLLAFVSVPAEWRTFIDQLDERAAAFKAVEDE